MIERRIKELSITLEALSRVQGSFTTYYEVQKLPDAAIAEAKEEKQSTIIPPTQTPTIHDDCPF